MRRAIVLMLLLATAPAAAQPMQQGWTQSEREIFRNSPVGSRLIPYAWFLHLEQPGGTASFAAPDHLATYFYLPAPANATNPDALPIGLARERAGADGFWLGVTCAACHVGRVTIHGTPTAIDGAGSPADIQAFDRDLSAALEQTAADDARFARFAEGLGTAEADRPALRDRLSRIAAQRAAATAMNATPAPAGPGRIDLPGLLANAVTATALGQPGNAHPPLAPLRYPRLWADMDPGMPPLLRDIGQVLAIYGTVDLAAPPPYPGSTSLFDLVKIEALLRKLEPPPWPAALPPIDQAGAERGRTVFNRACAFCHQPAGPPVRVAPDQLGTDPAALQQRPPATTGALLGRPIRPGGAAFGPQAAPAIIIAHVTAGIAAQLPRQATAPEPARPAAYAAPNLAGIWAAAPYLHNGAVPNLVQLLTPPAERVRSFSFAPTEFDPAAIGLPTGPTPAAPVFDTTQPGNANSGHDYGTTLPDEAKQNLLEFLKTL